VRPSGIGGGRSQLDELEELEDEELLDELDELDDNELDALARPPLQTPEWEDKEVEAK